MRESERETQEVPGVGEPNPTNCHAPTSLEKRVRQSDNQRVNPAIPSKGVNELAL